MNAEDVAFNDPPAGAAEQMILNRHLQRLLRHARLSAFQRFIQQACTARRLPVCGLRRFPRGMAAIAILSKHEQNDAYALSIHVDFA